MHQHVMPQRLVESRGGGSAHASSSNAEQDTAERPDAIKVEAPRIPHLFPSSASGSSSASFALHGRGPASFHLPHQQQQPFFHQRSAADLMLGLKTLATHADRQAPVATNAHESALPGSFPSSASSVSMRPGARYAIPHGSTTTTHTPGLLPPLLAMGHDAQSSSSSRDAISPPQTEEKSQSLKVAPVPFGDNQYAGRKHKRGESRLPDNATTSPSGSRYPSPGGDRNTITLSPSSTAAPAPRVLPVSSTIAWRSTSTSSSIFPPETKRFRTNSPVRSGGATASHNLLAQSPVAPQKTSFPLSSILAPPASSSTTNPPPLVRKVSSKWRDELADFDRRKTRERIQRGFARHCDGNYDVLLLLVASIEEELLHIKTNSKEHYEQQADALSAEVRHAHLER